MADNEVKDNGGFVIKSIRFTEKEVKTLPIKPATNKSFSALVREKLGLPPAVKSERKAWDFTHNQNDRPK